MMKLFALRKPWTLAVLCASVLPAFHAYSDIISTVNVSQDLMIFGLSNGTARNAAYANGPIMFSGADSGLERKRSLLQFDLSSIPSGATITSATMTLYLAQVAGTGNSPPSDPNTYDRTLSLYTINQSWVEGPAGTPTDGLGGYGHGVTATTGDVTWDYAYYSSDAATAVKWSDGTTALHGGNYNTTASAATTINYLVLNNAYTWSSAGMVADVQSWINNPAMNYGWEMISSVETTSKSYLGFYTQEGASVFGSTYMPTLTVSYTVPEPASMALLGFGCFALLSRRRNLLLRQH